MIRNYSRVLFNSLKLTMQNASGGLSDTQGKFLKASFPENRTTSVVEDLETPLPGYFFGNDSSQTALATIKAGSTVDSRPETPDLIYLEYGKDTYVSSEYPSSRQGGLKTFYDLQKIVGKRRGLEKLETVDKLG